MKIFNILIAAGILILFLAFFRGAPRTFASLNASWITVLGSGDLGLLLEQVGTDGAGEHVLPPLARAGISLLRAGKVTAYRFSAAVGRDEEIRQRLVEGAYPLRCSDQAHYLLQLEQEAPAQDCSQVSRGGGMVLVYCP